MGGGEILKCTSAPIPLSEILSNEPFPWSGNYTVPQHVPEKGRLVDPLPFSVAYATTMMHNHLNTSKIYAQQCLRCAEAIVNVRVSRDKVVRQMEDLAASATHPAVKESYLNAIQTSVDSFAPAVDVQVKGFADMESRYIQSLQEAANYEFTISFMEGKLIEPTRTTEQALERTASHFSTIQKDAEVEVRQTQPDPNENSNSLEMTNSDKPEPDIRLQQLMPYWAVINENDASPHHFDRYHRCDQGFNFEGWDDDEKAKLTAVIFETHRDAEREIEKHCERHTNWEEQYPRLFIDFPAFLANTSGCGTAFGRGRVNFVENINEQILDPNFRRCLTALDDVMLRHIKAIVITAKKGPLKGNKLMEAQYYDGELIVLWNDLNNISPTSISFDELKSCLST